MMEMEFIEKMWRVFSEKEFKESEPIKEIMLKDKFIISMLEMSKYQQGKDLDLFCNIKYKTL